MPTDTRHVLKFRKNPFRGVNGIDSLKIRCKTDGRRRPAAASNRETELTRSLYFSRNQLGTRLCCCLDFRLCIIVASNMDRSCFIPALCLLWVTASEPPSHVLW